MQKLLIVTPHMSTGGLPQYLLWQVSQLKNTFDVLVVEYSFCAGFTIQRDKLVSILPSNRFVSLLGEKNLIKVLEDFNPDLVYFAEFPERFVDFSTLDSIYKKDRKYQIFETTHTSEKTKKIYFPDRFIFVSQYSCEMFKDLNIPIQLLEYPIIKKDRPDRASTLIKLGLNPNKKHILNVGLFTPGKNQGEIIDYARLLMDYEFHFIGNTANNFKAYWQPLVDSLPSNCFIHGEKDNVDEWLSCCDLFLFTSNTELNPLALKEAIGWNIKILMKNLPTYSNRYTESSNLLFLSEDKSKNLSLIKKLINTSTPENDFSLAFGNLKTKRPLKLKLVHVLNNKDGEREVKSINSLSKLSNLGIEYIQQITPLYEGDEFLKNKPLNWSPEAKYNKAHYGNFISFKKAFLENFTEDIDAFIYCECDCVMVIPDDKILDEISKTLDYCNKNNVYQFSWGGNVREGTARGEILSRDIDFTNYCIVSKIVGSHFLILPKASRQYFLDSLNKSEWDTLDFWFNIILVRDFGLGKQANTFDSLANYVEGVSYIDNCWKETMNIRYDDHYYENLNKEVLKKKEIEIPIDSKPLVTYHFASGPFVSIDFDKLSSFQINFLDKQTNILEYSTEIKSNCWASCNKRFFVDWNINIKQKGHTIFNYDLNLENQKVFISINSEALGDTIAWFPYVEEFRKKHKCNIICSTFFNFLFEKNYPHIKFVLPSDKNDNIFAHYSIGCWDTKDRNKTTKEWYKQPLQEVATSQLGLQFSQIKPIVSLDSKLDIHKKHKKFICIATESTSRCKLWNNPNGWLNISSWLIKMGYQVINISRGGQKIKGVLNVADDEPLTSVMSYIKNCELFIGLPSGLSWLSWAMNKHVVMIVGISEPWCEFTDGITRISPPPSKCSGCFNIHEFDRNDWNWCPEDKNFECTKTIIPEMVKKQILPLLKK
jgi:autotransporter strand-loop-strand O-heptosyltransferase